MDYKKHPDTSFKPIGELSKREAAQEIKALREGIKYHDYLYYVKNRPTISDSVYDWMKRNSCIYLKIAESLSVLISHDA